MKRRLSGMAWVFIAFVPWILFGILSGAGLLPAAVVAGLGSAAVLNAYRLSRHQAKTMEVATLVFFTAHFMSTVVLNTPLFVSHGVVLVNGTLAVMAWGSLLAGTPFTYEYAREDWPPEYWNNPLFRRTNEIVTAIWGVIFGGNACLSALSLVWPDAGLLLTALLPGLGIAGGVVFSLRFPNWYSRRMLRLQLTAREPFSWAPPVFAAARPAERARHDVVVVGAGIGGLAAAAILAKRGLKVLVLEQHFLPGGYCTSWERGVRRGDQRFRYVFDAGVHDVSGLGPRGAVRSLLRQLDLEDRLDWRRMTHEYMLPGLRLRIPEDSADFIALLGKHFPAERRQLTAFFAEMEAVYHELYADIERTGGVPCPPRTVEEMLAYPRRHPHAFRWMETPFGEMLETYFSNPSLRRCLSVLTGYLSDDPERLTVAAMAPIFGYYFDGGYYPAGGSQMLSSALVDVIRQYGSEVRLRTPVARIVVGGNRAAGVELADGTIHSAEAVISNADVRRTFLDLVGRERLPAEFAGRIETLEFSASAAHVFLGVDYVPDLEPITMLEADDGRSVYIATPSKVDPSLAPPGHASMVLITLVPQVEAVTWKRKEPGYAERKRRLGDELIALAERATSGLRQHIVYRQDGSPASCARYAWTAGGAIYGPAAGRPMLPNKTPVEHLYLAGAGTFPGAGVEAVVISGTLAADVIYRGRRAIQSTHHAITAPAQSTRAEPALIDASYQPRFLAAGPIKLPFQQHALGVFQQLLYPDGATQPIPAACPDARRYVTKPRLPPFVDARS